MDGFDMIQLKKCTLSRQYGGTALRTDEIAGIGTAPSNLRIGESFVIFAEAFDGNPEGVRGVNTSPLVDFSCDGTTAILSTRSGSVYKVEYQTS